MPVATGSASVTARWAGHLIAGLGVVAGLLAYFGSVVTDYRYRYLGVPVSLFDFGPEDYVLRSVAVVYRPVGLLGLAGLIVVRVRPTFVVFWNRLVASRKWLHRLGQVVIVGAAVWFAAVGLASTFLDRYRFPISRYYLGPLYLTVGVFGLDHMWSRVNVASRDPVARSFVNAFRVVIATAGIFWIVASYAVTIGERSGRAIALDIPSKSAVTIVTASPLDLPQGTSIALSRVEDGSEAGYRYEGLRLLAKAGDFFVLVPANWQHGQSPTLIVPTSEVRLLRVAT
jgi:hypothetical protein